MLSGIARRWRTAIEAAAVAAVLAGVKVIAHYLGIEFLNVTPLITSIIAGGIFLFGLILAGTLSDYKESEKMPAEFVSACESIYGDGVSLRDSGREFDLDYLKETLLELTDGFFADASDPESREALKALKRLPRSFREMEVLGVPPNHVVRLKGEEASIRKGLLRLYHIQRTDFLPSAYILVEMLVLLLMGLLVFIKIKPLFDAIIVLVLLSFLFTYIFRMLKTLDRPFRAGEKTMDDVSLFLVHEFRDRLTGGVEGADVRMGTGSTDRRRTEDA